MRHVYALLIYAAALSLLAVWFAHLRSTHRLVHHPNPQPRSTFSVRQQRGAQPPDMFVELNEEAKASDLAGLRKYSRTLVGYLVGAEASKVNLDPVVDRLAQAELEMRQGKRKAVSELAIADAFNELMKQTGAPALKAKLADVEKSRVAFASAMPAVIPPDKARCCSPGEAVWVEIMLIQNIGAHYPQDSKPLVGVYTPPAQASLTKFLWAHSVLKNTNLLTTFEKHLGI